MEKKNKKYMNEENIKIKATEVAKKELQIEEKDLNDPKKVVSDINKNKKYSAEFSEEKNQIIIREFIRD